MNQAPIKFKLESKRILVKAPKIIFQESVKM